MVGAWFALLTFAIGVAPALGGCRAAAPEERPLDRPVVADVALHARLPASTLQSTFVIRSLATHAEQLLAVGDPGLWLLGTDGAEGWMVETPGRARAVARWGDAWLVADGSAGLGVVRDGAWIRALDLGGEVTHVATEGDQVVATLEEGQLIVLTGNGDDLIPRAAIEVPGYPRFVGFAGPHDVWVVAKTYGVQLVDVMDPEDPKLVATWTEHRKMRACALDGSRLVLADWTRRGAILEATAEGGIAEELTFDVDGLTHDVALRRDRLLIANEGGLLSCFRISSEDLSLEDSIEVQARVVHLRTDDALLYDPAVGLRTWTPGGALETTLEIDPHRPRRLTRGAGEVLSLSEGSCNAVVFDVGDGAERARIEPVDRPCAAAVATARGWVFGGNRGMVLPTGEVRGGLDVTDLAAIPGSGVVGAALMNEGLVLLDEQLEPKRPARCDIPTDTLLAPTADGRIALLGFWMAELALTAAEGDRGCERSLLQGPAVDAVVDADGTLVVAERLFGIEAFDVGQVAAGPTGRIPIGHADPTAVETTLDRLFVGLGEWGIQVYAREGGLIGDHLATWDTPGTVGDLLVADGQLWIADGWAVARVELEELR